MSTLDTILLIILGIFFVLGFVRGFIREVGSFIGLFVALWVASNFHPTAASYLLPYTKQWPLFAEPLATAIGFFGLFFISQLVFGIFIKILDFVVRRMSPIPFLKLTNRLAGGAVGIAEGLLLLSAVLFFVVHIPIFKDWQAMVEKSLIAPQIKQASKIIQPFLPDPTQLTSSFFNSKSFDKETREFMKKLQTRYGEIQNIDFSNLDLRSLGIDEESLPPEIQSFLKSQNLLKEKAQKKKKKTEE